LCNLEEQAVTGGTDHVAQAVALDPGAGEAIWFLQSRMTIKATAESTKGAYGLLEVVIPPGYSPPLHVHHREDESFYVLEGRLTLRCGDVTYSAAASSYIFLPGDVPHGFVVEGDTPVRMLNLLSPGGGEGFFVEAGRPADGEGLPPADPIDIARLRRAGSMYGAEIVGPPLTPGDPGDGRLADSAARRSEPLIRSYHTSRITDPRKRGRALRKEFSRRAKATFVAPDRDPVAILEDQDLGHAREGGDGRARQRRRQCREFIAGGHGRRRGGRRRAGRRRRRDGRGRRR
jgi:quercetin dioxygenase-like cupin family protein